MNVQVKPTKIGATKDMDIFGEEEKGFEVVNEDFVKPTKVRKPIQPAYRGRGGYQRPYGRPNQSNYP